MKAGLAFLLAASLFFASCSSRAREDLPDAGSSQPPFSSSSQPEEPKEPEPPSTSSDISTSSAEPALESSSDIPSPIASSSGIQAESTAAPEQAPPVSSSASQADASGPSSKAPADDVSSSADALSTPSSQPAQDASSSQVSSEDTAAQADEGSSDPAAPRMRAAGNPADDPSFEVGQEEDEETSSEPEKKPAYNLTSKYFLSDVENEFIKILNEERQEAGLSRLKKDGTLSSAARLRAAEQVKNSYFAHKRPDGRDWNTVLSEEFPCSFTRQGENLASASYEGGSLSHQTAQQWYDQWEASPSHYENMFRPEFTYIGVGIYYSYEDGSYSSIAATLFAAD